MHKVFGPPRVHRKRCRFPDADQRLRGISGSDPPAICVFPEASFRLTNRPVKGGFLGRRWATTGHISRRDAILPCVQNARFSAPLGWQPFGRHRNGSWLPQFFQARQLSTSEVAARMPCIRCVRTRSAAKAGRFPCRAGFGKRGGVSKAAALPGFWYRRGMLSLAER